MNRFFSYILVALLTVFGNVGCPNSVPKAEQLARKIHIKLGNFRDATFEEVVNYLNDEVQTDLSGDEKLNVHADALSGIRITSTFKGRTLYDSLQEIAKETGLSLTWRNDEVYFDLPAAESQVLQKDRLREEDNIREAVFRYMFGDNASGEQNHVFAYFISINGRDPDEAFMARFAMHHPQVKKDSQSGRGESGAVVDATTGKHGLSFDVGNIKWLSSTKVAVEGSYYEASVSASGNTYELTHTVNGWFVTKDTRNFISFEFGVPGFPVVLTLTSISPKTVGIAAASLESVVRRVAGLWLRGGRVAS